MSSDASPTFPAHRRCAPTLATVATVVAMTIRCGGGGNVSGPSTFYHAGIGGNYATIAEALTAAPAGSIIRVMPGIHAERIVITKAGTRLLGSGAPIIEGASIGGSGIGIHVQGVGNVEISGLTVQNFERGIVLEGVTNSLVMNNEVRTNTNKSANTSPPLAPFVTPYEGIVLFASSGNQILDNFVHDNGHDGIMLGDASNGNVIRDNRIASNGSQTTPGLFG